MEAFQRPEGLDAPLAPVDRGKFTTRRASLPAASEPHSPGKPRKYRLVSYDRRIRLTERVKFDVDL